MYKDQLNISASIKIAKDTLAEYSDLLRFIDQEIYDSCIGSSWNYPNESGSAGIGYKNYDQKMLNMIDANDRKHEAKLIILQKVQISLAKLSDEKTEILYLKFVKNMSDYQIEKRLSISSTTRKTRYRDSCLAFSIAHGIEVFKKAKHPSN